MKKLKLYLETSVFGFYFDTAASNKQKRIADSTSLSIRQPEEVITYED